jgi:hypothetical protein
MPNIHRRPILPITTVITSPSNRHEVVAAPYTGTELPVTPGTIIGETAVIQYNNNVQAYFTWNGTVWVLNFIDNILLTKLRAKFLEPCDYTFINGQSKDIVIEVEEFGGKATTGDIQIIVGNLPAFTVTYNGALTVSNTPVTSVYNSIGVAALTDFAGSKLLTISDILQPYQRRKFAITLTATGSNNSNSINIILFPNTGGSVTVGGDSQRVTTAPL